MSFSSVPFDSHNCLVVFGTFEQAAHEVELRFIEDPETGEEEPVRYNPGAVAESSTSGWEVTGVGGEGFDQSRTGSKATESSVKMRITLKRVHNHLVRDAVVPVMLMVSATWVSFFIDRNTAAPRITLCVVSLLAILQQNAKVL